MIEVRPLNKKDIRLCSCEYNVLGYVKSQPEEHINTQTIKNAVEWLKKEIANDKTGFFKTTIERFNNKIDKAFAPILTKSLITTGDKEEGEDQISTCKTDKPSSSKSKKKKFSEEATKGFWKDKGGEQ